MKNASIKIFSLTLLSLSLAATAVSAQESSASATTTTSEAPIYERGGLAGTGLVLGLKGALTIGQVYDSAGLGGVGELELGWVTPYSPLQIFATGSFAATSRDEVVDPDARLPGEFSYDYSQQQFVLTLGALYRIPLSSDFFRPYAALGGRMYLSSTEITGASAGESFGSYTEEGTDYGFYGAIGADFFVGPGSILLEFQTGYAPVDRFVLNDTNIGSFNIALGYRLFL